MIAISNSCFNLIYLLKRLQGFEGHAQCAVISQYSHIVKCNSAAGDCSLLGFLCVYIVYFMQIYQAVWRASKHFCVTAPHCHETTFPVMDVVQSVTWRTLSMLSINFLVQMGRRGLLSSVRCWHPLGSDCITCSSVCFPPKCLLVLTSTCTPRET